MAAKIPRILNCGMFSLRLSAGLARRTVSLTMCMLASKLGEGAAELCSTIVAHRLNCRMGMTLVCTFTARICGFSFRGLT